MADPLPVDYLAPAVNPAGYGLEAAATLLPGGTPARFLFAGVEIRPFNCETAYGSWPAEPCADPPVDTLKEGDRVAPDDPFLPHVSWAYDECGPDETDTEVTARARQTLRLHDPLLVESDFATRILDDAPTPAVVETIVEAVSALEVALKLAGYSGVLHASAAFAAQAAAAHLLLGNGPVYKTPLGNSWAFGGGYDDVLETTIVATGPVTMWQGDVLVNTVLDERHNRRAAVVERATVVGYECLVAAVTVTPA